MLEPFAINPREASRITGFSIKWFEHQRLSGKGPPWVKLANKRIRYPYPEFKAWWASQTGRAAA